MSVCVFTQTVTAHDRIELTRSNSITAEVHADVHSHIFIEPAAHPDYLFIVLYLLFTFLRIKTAQQESRDIDFGICSALRHFEVQAWGEINISKSIIEP